VTSVKLLARGTSSTRCEGLLRPTADSFKNDRPIRANPETRALAGTSCTRRKRGRERLARGQRSFRSRESQQLIEEHRAPLRNVGARLASRSFTARHVVTRHPSMTTSTEPRPSPAPIEPAIAERWDHADPTDPWACTLLGMRHAVTPGQAEVSDRGVERAWIDGRPVPLDAFRVEAERSVREQAKRLPNGALAQDLARLDAMRANARAARAGALRALSTSGQPRRVRTPWHRRAPRRARRVGIARRVRARGADPPEPPGEGGSSRDRRVQSGIPDHSDDLLRQRGTAPGARAGAARSRRRPWLA
jgi:hypothetical protein